MKNLIIFLLFTLSAFSSFGQDYINYYNLCNEADKEIYFKNSKAALVNLENAFELVDYVHASQFEKASKCAIHIEDYKKGFLYAKKAILNGSSNHFWKSKKLKKIRKTTYYQILNDSVAVWEKIRLKSINYEYKKLIDSLYYIDQRIIRNNKTVKGNYKIDKINLPENLFDLDSIIFQRLLKSIDKFGFPSERNIGYEGYDKAWILFHHNVRLPQNHYYINFLVSALKKGEYRPRDFAWMYDQGKLNIGESPLFYYGVPLPKKLTEEKKNKIDESRKKFGVKPLASTKTKTIGRRTVMKVLW